jgi:hypothetical protein
MDYSDQVFYGFIRRSDGLVLVCPGFDGAPNDLGGGELLPAGDPRNTLPRFVVQSQCQRRCHGVTLGLILPYYAMYYKNLRRLRRAPCAAGGLALIPRNAWPFPVLFFIQ